MQLMNWTNNTLTEPHAGVLYISYDGMLEPLGQSQVLAYLERLGGRASFHLISFEKPADFALEDRRINVARRIAQAGIIWHPLRYHKRPSAPATAYDIAQGVRLGVTLMLRHKLSIIHARSYVPSVMALAIKRLTGARFLFDMRGFWADERVDGGLWPRGGGLYRFAKDFERRFLLAADAVVSLTEAGRREIETFTYLAGRLPPITVIPTCADLDRFRPDGKSGPSEFTLGCVGGAGTWYLFDEALAVFRALKRIRPDARFLIVNRGEHDFIRGRLSVAGLSMADIELLTAGHQDMPALVQRMTAGIALIKPAYSKTASAPTKLAEYLGCGIPCLVSSGVGDLEALVARTRVGVVMHRFADEDCDEAAKALVDLVADPQVGARCVATAQRHFSLEAGALAYASIYASLSA
jgi:glycosyltransferase involved in cell wall biosynthesis